MRISDWSSDVCSSDLTLSSSGCTAGLAPGLAIVPVVDPLAPEAGVSPIEPIPTIAEAGLSAHTTVLAAKAPADRSSAAAYSVVRIMGNLRPGYHPTPEIGRASREERVCKYV